MDADMPTAEQFRETAARFKLIIEYGLAGMTIGDNEVARAALACDVAADLLEGRRSVPRQPKGKP